MDNILMMRMGACKKAEEALKRIIEMLRSNM
jgi:hypothetical protein